MLGALRSSAARAARSSVRQMSSAPLKEMGTEMQHAQKEADKWRIITFVAIPGCIAFTALTMSNAHTHHRNAPDYPYLNYKVRDFPWGPDALFGTK